MATQDSDQDESVLVVLVLDLGYLVSQEHLPFAKSNSSEHTACLPSHNMGRGDLGCSLGPRPPGEGLPMWLSWRLTHQGLRGGSKRRGRGESGQDVGYTRKDPVVAESRCHREASPYHG